MNVNPRVAFATVALVWMTAIASAAETEWISASSAGRFEDAPTRPSDLRQLSFTQPGQIAKVEVEEGDVVEEGAPLIRLDDVRERQELKILELLANDITRIEYAEAALGQAKVDEQILLQAEKDEPGSVTSMELQHAKLEVQLKEASLEIAKIEQKQAQSKRDQTKILLDKMVMSAPMDGRIERVLYREGESANALEKVLVIVQLDPLWVDMPVPVAKARPLKVGQKARVRYVEDIMAGKADGVVGKIIHKSGLVDSGSNTLTVRVEIPNPDKRPAGSWVRVQFDAAAAKAVSTKQ